MRVPFLDMFAARCPRCGGLWRPEGKVEPDRPLLHGWLRCSNAACDARAPVIDGIPVLTPRPEASLSANAAAWLRREDLPADLDEVLNAATGANSWSDTPRQQVSTYAWDHYGDLDSLEADDDVPPGAVVRLLDEALTLLPELPEGPALDAGCATGRTTLHLAARTGGPVLGVDLNAAFLRVAQRVLTTSFVRYDLRKNGLCYDRREYEVILPAMPDVDFWMADATQLPLPDQSLGLVTALNVVDSCDSPTALIREFSRILRPDGCLLICAPFDWSAAVTPVEQWLGGSPGQPDSEAALRSALVAAGMTIVAESEGFPWTLRLHGRSGVTYRSMVVAARKG